MPTASVQSVLDAFSVSFSVSSAPTELLAAARLGDVRSAIACLQQGVDPNVRASIPECNHPVTALCVSASCGHASCVEMLLRAGARADHFVGNRYTPLYLAAQGGHEESLALILAAHAQAERHSLMEFTTADGATPLMVASHMGHIGCVNALLREGASFTSTAPDGTALNAFDVAVAAGHTECAELIRACAEFRARSDSDASM